MTYPNKREWNNGIRRCGTDDDVTAQTKYYKRVLTLPINIYFYLYSSFSFPKCEFDDLYNMLSLLWKWC